MSELTNFETVCFIGSMKFWNEMLVEAQKFHQSGKIVILPIKDPRKKIPSEDLDMYDRLIRSMIDMSDTVHVINKNRYIGKSVAGEIKYAKSLNKPITYMEEPMRIATLCGPYKFTAMFNELTEAFTRAGILTLIPSFLNLNTQMMNTLTGEQIKNLHDIHDMKIDMCDVVVLVDREFNTNKTCIGENTQREIDYAESINKKILKLSEVVSISDLIAEIKQSSLVGTYRGGNNYE